MEYVLTRHARDALAKRAITLEWMEKVLTAPEATEMDKVDPQLEHRLGRVADRNNRTLRVVVNTAVLPMRVVTVFFDRRKRR